MNKELSNDYEQRVVAFIDILGFSGMVRGLKSSHDEYNKLSTALSKIKTYENIVNESESTHSRLVVSAFSDCVAISSKPEHISSIIHACGFFFHDFLFSGLALRGGIATGKLHHNNGIIFGEPLIEAYEIETKVSNYPRIVVSSHALELISDFNMQYFKQDRDGLHYLNMFAFNTTQHGDNKYYIEGYNHRAEYLRQVKSQIERNIISAIKLDHKAKWHWLATEYNEAIDAEFDDLDGNNSKIKF